LAVLKSTSDAAKADLESLQSEINMFEANRMTPETSYGDALKRFPAQGKIVEKEIAKHEWYKECIEH
jgi:hypothetical protein